VQDGSEARGCAADLRVARRRPRPVAPDRLRCTPGRCLLHGHGGGRIPVPPAVPAGFRGADRHSMCLWPIQAGRASCRSARCGLACRAVGCGGRRLHRAALPDAGVLRQERARGRLGEPSGHGRVAGRSPGTRCPLAARHGAVAGRGLGHHRGAARAPSRHPLRASGGLPCSGGPDRPGSGALSAAPLLPDTGPVRLAFRGPSAVVPGSRASIVSRSAGGLSSCGAVGPDVGCLPVVVPPPHAITRAASDDTAERVARRRGLSPSERWSG